MERERGTGDGKKQGWKDLVLNFFRQARSISVRRQIPLGFAVRGLLGDYSTESYFPDSAEDSDARERFRFGGE